MKSTNQIKIILNGQEFEYIITYKKIKNIYFRINENLIINVSAPKLTNKKYIENILYCNSDAIIKMYQKQKAKAIRNEDIYYLGNKLEFRYCEGKPYLEENLIYAKSTYDAKEYIYSLAFEVFSRRLNSFIPLFDSLPNFRLRVRKMKSKWGVCNIKSMTVTLNTELITKDVHLIDYVIVHELCHFKHMNHGTFFWQEVSKYYPYYKEARRELNY